MARNKESLILLFDVGPAMHKFLPEIGKLCSTLVQKKLIYHKNDDVGIVLFGTEVLDAIVVGMDILIKKFGKTNKGKKRICLITSAQCPIKEPYEGTKEDQVSTIAEQMAVYGMKMHSIVVRGDYSSDADTKIMDENDFLLSVFSKKTRAKTVHVESPTSLRGALKTRNIAPVTTFRGDLEISQKVKIKVWVYKKTAQEKFPTLKKYSDRAPPTDKFAMHEVKVDFEYRNTENSSKVVPPEQRIKGFRYGPQVIPISPAELDAVKFKPEKSVKLLGFTNASNIMRHYYMKDVSIFIAEPGKTKDIRAVSALAKAMKQTSKVAIVRCVWRQGQGSVVIGVLTPNISKKNNVADSFYFNVLPFAEDIREFQFPSFSKLPSAWQPNKEQQEAADNFVRMLSLVPPGKEEVLQPDLTPNPVLERFYRYLDLKSKHPDAGVPPIDETLKKITEPDPELFSQSKSVIDAFRNCFQVKENPKLKKSAIRLMKDESFIINSGIGDPEAVGDAETRKSMKNQLNITVQKVGKLNPILDFETMMKRRDDPEWINKAIEGLQKIVIDFLEDSFEGDNYDKALECLVALRKGCIFEQEPTQFNDFMRYVYTFCQEKDVDGFCVLMSKGIGLITKTEAIDSNVNEDESTSFMCKT